MWDEMKIQSRDAICKVSFVWSSILESDATPSHTLASHYKVYLGIPKMRPYMSQYEVISVEKSGDAGVASPKGINSL